MSRLDALLSRLSVSGTLAPQLFLVAFTLLMILPGFFTLPPVDRDETRFAQASRQMIESGDLIDIRLGDGTRYKKPVGIYWLQTAALTLVGSEAHLHDIWAYRLPSALAALCAVLLTYLIALRLMGAEAALLAGVLLAVGFVFGAEARLAKTDATLLATILLSQWSLARLWSGEPLSRRAALLFWLGLSLSILVKGPIGPMVIGCTVVILAIWRRDVRWLSGLHVRAGLLLCALVVLPWFIAITIHSGGAFWQEALGKDLLSKVSQGQESHGAPPGSYLLAVWITFWPGAVLLPFAALAVARGWRTPAVVFCLAWCIPTWLIFELTATKLLHYVLPTYPALAMLAAAGWTGRTTDQPLGRGMKAVLALLLLIGALFPVASAYVSLHLGGALSTWWAMGCLLLLGGAWLTWRAVASGQHLAPVVGLGALSLGMSLTLFAHLARVSQLWPSVDLASYVTSAQCEGPNVISLGYQEESLMLLSPAPVTFSHSLEATRAALNAAPCAIVFVSAEHLDAFNATSAQDQTLRNVGTVDGFAIGGADPVTLTVFERP